MRILTLLVACTWMFVGSAFAAPKAEQIEFFEKKIRPVLIEHCYKCHSVEKKRGGLLLDSRAGTRKGGDTGPVLIPGKPDKSLLLTAVDYSQDDLRMPPKGKLPDDAIADLRKWIEMGAPDPRDGSTVKTETIDIEEGRNFWAYQPITKSIPPKVALSDWPRSDIDRFLLAQLEAKGLQPVGDADRGTLLRRVTFALTGLPPTPAEIESFRKDGSPDAFARVVDRLLDSPRFGEHWGRHWLDVARFAESTGGGRSLLLQDAWRYRDYVIDSFNRDKPYDRFVHEQMAGDLLPYDSPHQRAEQIVGTAFLALGPTNYERQDKEILEMDVIDEQLDTFGRTFLGLTIGCARCHDHKFDPIPTADYYALAGIFHSTKTMIHNNVSKWVEVPLPMDEALAAKVKAHQSQVKALEAKIKSVKATLAPSGKSKGSRLSVKELPGIVIDDVDAKKVGEWKQSVFHKNYIGEGYLHDQNGGKGTMTVTYTPKFTEDGDYEVRFAYTPGTNRDDKVPVTIFSADGEKVVYVNEKRTPPIDGHFVSLGTHRFESNNQWFVMVSNEGTTEHVIADAVQFLPVDEKDAKPEPTKPVSKTEDASARAELKKMEAQLKKLKGQAPKRPMTMAVLDVDKPHDIAICIRGNYHSQGKQTQRGFLQVLSPERLPSIPEETSGRLQLAHWLTSPDNPLTARVMVNRVWHHLYGVGLVRTVDNFGKMGELPSHPKLLDWLAARFVEEGWSVKQLVREIVLSRAFQLSVESSEKNSSVDPENRLLWRMNRRRLEAEAIRDSILMVSGQLDVTMGGPTIRKGTSIEYGYKFDDVRRSVYTPVFRNRLLELYEVFDFADPNLVMGRRNVSTVPTQSLYLMNSPFVMEQAQEAAKALLEESGSDDVLVDRAYLRTLGREPNEQERTVALRFVQTDSDDPKQRLAVWERFHQVLFACIDFRYVQ